MGKNSSKKSPVILLPKDPELVAKLRRKLEEYRSRIAAYNHEHPNQHPYFREQVLALEICKEFILERVLKDGRVVLWDLSLEFAEECKKKDKEWMVILREGWNPAAGVIKDYCETGGANVSTGTGLK